MHTLHLAVLGLRDGLFYCSVSLHNRYFRELMNIYLELYTYFFTCLLPLLHSSLLPWASFQEYISLKGMNYKVNYSTAIIKEPIKLIKENDIVSVAS